jgi:hypothetical protein
MNYYGNFAYADGCGTMWRPYFASAVWNPYANGTWAWYSGTGYSWVSPYPWGWLPYHFGSWSYCPSLGWGWLPGGAWMGLGNGPIVLNQPRTSPGLPHPVMPPRPVEGMGPSLVTVNQKPLESSVLGPRDTFVFHNDSAGLGIPRGTLGKLQGFSNDVARRGTSSTQVYSFPVATGNTHGSSPVTTGHGVSTEGPAAGSELRTISRSTGYSGASSRAEGGDSRGGASGMSSAGMSSASSAGMSHGSSASAPSGGHR